MWTSDLPAGRIGPGAAPAQSRTSACSAYCAGALRKSGRCAGWRRWLREEHAPEVVLTAVTEEVARHLAADAAMTVRYDGRGGAASSPNGAGGLPTRLAVGAGWRSGRGGAARGFKRWLPARVDSYERMEGVYAREMRGLGMRSGVAAPILVDGDLWGAVRRAPRAALHRGRRAAARRVRGARRAGDRQRRCALKLKESRARIVEAADAARRRLERDLHDGAQQRLVGLAIHLRLLASQVGPATAPAVEGCIGELLAALEELRELARGLHPAVLSERG